MKKIILVVICLLLVLSGCSKKEESLIFTGVITEVDDTRLKVIAEDMASFTEIFVNIDTTEMDFEPRMGQSVEVTTGPEIRESFPPVAIGEKILLQTGYRRITPEEAKAFIDEGTYGTILDVRTEAEYLEGHLENATLLPDNEIESKAEITLYDKNELILVYCRSGRRSEAATEKLIQMGYTNVYDLGGIQDWPYEIVK